MAKYGIISSMYCHVMTMACHDMM